MKSLSFLLLFIFSLYAVAYAGDQIAMPNYTHGDRVDANGCHRKGGDFKRTDPQWKCEFRDSASTTNLLNFQALKYQAAYVAPAKGFGTCGTSPIQTLPLVNFFLAGYRQNNAPIPYRKRPATLLYGEGHHTITNVVNLKSGNVLRGAGRDKTVLYFPKGLREIGPLCNNDSCYEWDDSGLIIAQGSEIGIEDLTVEFPAHAYEHWRGVTNNGFNAITLASCTNCWIKNVTVRNSDRGIFVSKSSDSAVDGAHVYANQQGSHIHIAISSRSKRIAVTNFEVYGISNHGLTGNWGPELAVFANGARDNVRIEPDHNCNGLGGSASCTKKFLYSNISGSGSIQENTGRDGNPLPSPATLWNVGKVDRCPLDAYTSQLYMRIKRH